MTAVLARRVTIAALGVGMLAASGCAGDKSGRGKTVVISTAGDADVLFPPTLQQGQALAVTEVIFDKLAEIGPDLTTVGDIGYQPRLAERWEWSPDSMQVTFHLNPRARWHDGAPVRANDVRFAFDVYTDPKVGSSVGGDISQVTDSISVMDSLTCKVWFKIRTPERFHQLAYNLKPLPEHLLGKVPHDSIASSPFASAPVGSGPFKLVRWVRKQSIEIAAVDDFYRGRPEIDRVIWSIVPENNVAVQRVFNGDADFIERVSSDEARAASKNASLQLIKAGGTTYGFIIFNMFDNATNKPNALFSNREMRRALTMALDRAAMVANVFDSLGRVSYGPFARVQWSADTTLRQIPSSREAAAKTLDSLGWKIGKDSIREKDGHKLEFSLVVPGSSEPRKKLAVIIQDQWKQIGVKLNVDVVENATYIERLNSHRFDAIFHSLIADPSPSGIRRTWTSSGAKVESGFNKGRYLNKSVDADLDNAVSSTNVDTARAHYHAAYQTLLDDAAGIWIYEPVVLAMASRRLATGNVRQDAWWSSIPAWRVDGAAGK